MSDLPRLGSRPDKLKGGLAGNLELTKVNLKRCMQGRINMSRIERDLSYPTFPATSLIAREKGTSKPHRGRHWRLRIAIQSGQ